MALNKKIVAAIFGTAIFSFLIAMLISFGLIIFFKISKKHPDFAPPAGVWNHYPKYAMDNDKVSKDDKMESYGWSYFMSEPDCLNACLSSQGCNTYSYDTSVLSNSCDLYKLTDLSDIGKASSHNTGSILTKN